ncbi:uncharacterized protein CTHT_0016250 [Thermochaetoides thermophila DSM 1495]|uniref:Mitochondrial protein n=1 Tax=Chaetomium thermophilum (strain DSM 1495 / CBS 144.50 / IMI 039719) TaxID=759272 RepID=G0S276_CHATD|nr:hypothetical protein CTHT_0016250 [Thermochaetoides thermophila DSM 1495]EGS22109.1 hypothetical protein CTHT_0016250 [Thermochaetoides thermophila DSM 1495]
MAPLLRILRQPVRTLPRHWARYISSQPEPEFQPIRRSGTKIATLLGVFAASGAGVLFAYPRLFPKETSDSIPPKGPQRAEIIFEKPHKKLHTKEETREDISPQHVQVKHSWEHPGVYAWGSNAGKVVAPESKETVVKSPRRIKYFDGQILRDLKLDSQFGVAVNEQGDLVQWGAGYCKEEPGPRVTLKGKDLRKVAISKDRIIALGGDGKVYSIPVSKADQELGEKPKESGKSLLGSIWNNTSEHPLNYRLLKPSSLGLNEKVVDVQSGLEHCLLLTSKGRVFSAAASSEAFPSRGQLGVPGLTWETRPQGVPYDTPHEVKGLEGLKITAIAAGDYHSLALDSTGRAFAFGDNTFGQLGVEPEGGVYSVDAPVIVPLAQRYEHSNQVPKITSIAAGGGNSFFTVDAIPKEKSSSKNPSSVTTDLWSCGSGLRGTLGTGKFAHMSPTLTKIKSLSNLTEYDESLNRLVPIRIASVSVGSDHAAAVLGNKTHLTASASTPVSDTNFGADVLWWGGNEHYQLGTGKRNNVAIPVHIAPLDGERFEKGVPAQGGGDVKAGELRQRLQITPRTKVKIGEKGREVSVEQKVICGRGVSGVYSAA